MTPHHLCLTDEAVRSLDPNLKMNPPLRTEADRAALLAALVDGTIEAIATDHAPHSREEKDVPFEAAPFGVTGLETAFAALYTSLVQPGLLPLETLLERMSAGPARIFGLDRPRIAVGAPANLVLLSTDATWRVHGGRLPLALDQLVAPRPAPHGQGAADGRGRAGRVRGMTAGRGSSCSRTAPSSPARWSAPTAMALGEAVFTTAMTGYQEVVTDPSFCGQIVCFTAPMVGNYGVADAPLRVGRRARARRRDARGARAGVDGLARRSAASRRSPASTRAASRSTCASTARCGRRSCRHGLSVEAAAVALARGEASMAGQALAGRVSTPAPYAFSEEGDVAVAVVDYGAKRSILAGSPPRARR